MKQRTPAYAFTVDPNSAVDMEKVEALRKGIKAVNAMNRLKVQWRGGEPELFRVTLKARLGKNNPAAPLYRSKRSGFNGWGQQNVLLEHAQRIDVYVQRRYS